MEIQCLNCKTTLKGLFSKCVCGKTFIQRGKVRSTCGFTQGSQQDQHQHQSQHQCEQTHQQMGHKYQGLQTSQEQ